MNMSLEQYQELAKQEQHDPPKSFFPRVWYTLKLLSEFVLYSRHTELEKALIKDDETFTSPLTNTYCFIDKVDGVGQVFGIKTPHPLRTQLNNSALSKELVANLESKINETPVLVFVHGLGGNLQQFDEVIKEFAEVADVFAIDLPGSGKSISERGFRLTLENLTNVLRDQIVKNEFREREIILVGHSYGTQVILKLSGLLPNVKGLVLLAPPKTPTRKTKKEKFFLNLFLRVPFLFEFFRKMDRLNNINSVSMNRLFANPETPEYLKFKQFRFNLLTNSTNFLRHALEWDPLSVSEILETSQLIDQHQGKILIIDGTHDKLTKQGGSTYYDLIGSRIASYEQLGNAGHNFILESYEPLNVLLGLFFERLEPKLSKTYVNELRSLVGKGQ